MMLFKRVSNELGPDHHFASCDPETLRLWLTLARYRNGPIPIERCVLRLGDLVTCRVLPPTFHPTPLVLKVETNAGDELETLTEGTAHTRSGLLHTALHMQSQSFPMIALRHLGFHRPRDFAAGRANARLDYACDLRSPSKQPR